MILYSFGEVCFLRRQGFQIEIKKLVFLKREGTVFFQWFFMHLEKCDVFFRRRGFQIEINKIVFWKRDVRDKFSMILNWFGKLIFFQSESFSNWNENKIYEILAFNNGILNDFEQ